MPQGPYFRWEVQTSRETSPAEKEADPPTPGGGGRKRGKPGRYRGKNDAREPVANDGWRSERDSNFAKIRVLQVVAFASFSRTVCLSTSTEVQRKLASREASELDHGQRRCKGTTGKRPSNKRISSGVGMWRNDVEVRIGGGRGRSHIPRRASITLG